MQLTFFTAEDKAVLSSWFASQQDVTQWAGPGVTWPLTDTFLDTLLDSASQKPAGLLTFAGRIQGKLVAVAQMGFDWDNRFVCLARVVVSPGMRGQKLAEQMLQTLIETAFRDPTLDRVELQVYPFNIAAVKTYERLGFVREGVRRACVVVGDECWDSAFYGLLRREYSLRSAA